MSARTLVSRSSADFNNIDIIDDSQSHSHITNGRPLVIATAREGQEHVEEEAESVESTTGYVLLDEKKEYKRQYEKSKRDMIDRQVQTCTRQLDILRRHSDGCECEATRKRLLMQIVEADLLISDAVCRQDVSDLIYIQKMVRRLTLEHMSTGRQHKKTFRKLFRVQYLLLVLLVLVACINVKVMDIVQMCCNFQYRYLNACAWFASRRRQCPSMCAYATRFLIRRNIYHHFWMFRPSIKMQWVRM